MVVAKRRRVLDEAINGDEEDGVLLLFFVFVSVKVGVGVGV